MKWFGLLMLFSGTVFAHSGGLNSEGCHNDNVGGEGYHCHNNNPEPEPEPTHTPNPLPRPDPDPGEFDYFYSLNQNNSVLLYEIPRLSSFYHNGSVKLQCIHTSSGFFNATLVYTGSVFDIHGLEQVSGCSEFSAKYSSLTGLLSIYSVNVGSNNYRASLELNNSGRFNLVYAENEPDELQDDSEYNRDDWGTSWSDLDGDCQNTRAEVLLNFNRADQDGCKLTQGTWIDPYSLEEFRHSSYLDIDHVVPLAYAHEHGGANWSPELKSKFFDDMENLLPVSAASNRMKGAKGPDEWMPKNTDYHCTYVDTFLYIVAKYQLDLTGSERAAINSRCAN